MSKKIKSIICCVCASLVLIVALCLPFAFKFNTKSTNYASADDVESINYFSGSNFPTVWSSCPGTNPLLSTTSLTNYAGYVSFAFVNSPEQTDIRITSLTTSFSSDSILNYTLSQVIDRAYNSPWTPASGSSSVWIEQPISLSSLGSYTSLFYRVGLDFDSVVVGCFLAQYVVPSGSFVSEGGGASNRDLLVSYFRYFGADAEGNLDTTNFIELSFISNQNLTFSKSQLASRTYYFSRVDSASAEYGAGYSAGQVAGYSAGESAGYNTGYSAGDSVGYTRGYNAGVDATNTYSFTNLISAVLDAPINAFTSLFNFEILGVNLSSFLLALFTICVVLTVIKFIF